MLNLRFTATFKRDYRRVKSQGKNLAKLDRQARNHIIEVADAYDQRWSAPLGFVANRGAKVDFYEVALFE